jgi:hypothetical protein
MQTDRSERILALLLLQQMKGGTMKEKAVQLSLAGFSNLEIADIVQTTPSVVAQLLYESRKTRSRVTGSRRRHRKAQG